MSKTKKSVWVATIDRFGYDLTVVEETEDKAREALIKEYIRTYKKYNNGSNPATDDGGWGRTYLEVMEEEIDCTEMTFGKVEWR